MAGTVAALLLLEGLAYAVYRVTFGEPFSFAAADRLKRERMAAADASRTSPAAGASTALVPHPFLGFVYNPRYNPEGTRSFHTVPASDWGFLDDKAPIRAPSPDEVTIGIFGGSVAFWFSVHGVEAMLDDLSKLARFRGKRFVVVRTALGGFKQPQQLMTLSYLLALGAHFDIVVNLDGFNEIALPPQTHVPRGLFPFYPRNWPDLLGEAGDLESVRLIARVLSLQDLAGWGARQVSGPILGRSVFVTTLWRAVDRHVAVSLGQARQELATYAPKLQADRRNYAFVGPERRYASAASMYADLTGVWRQSSLQMHRLCAANGILYAHFLQPNQYVAGSKPMDAAERRVALQPASSYAGSVRDGYPLLIQAGRELADRGVAFTDLTPLFRDVAEPRYTDACCHLDREGNRLLGRAIARSLAAAVTRRSPSTSP